MTPPLARVAWRIGSNTGHGNWLSPALAQAWAEWGCRTYGAGTHWVETQ